jgi:hypothetical protein
MRRSSDGACVTCPAGQFPNLDQDQCVDITGNVVGGHAKKCSKEDVATTAADLDKCTQSMKLQIADKSKLFYRYDAYTSKCVKCLSDTLENDPQGKTFYAIFGRSTARLGESSSVALLSAGKEFGTNALTGPLIPVGTSPENCWFKLKDLPECAATDNVISYDTVSK